MNKVIRKGDWNIVKGKLKETFGDLTDDDLTKMEGRTDRIVGVIQRRTGITREEVERRLREILQERDDRHAKNFK